MEILRSNIDYSNISTKLHISIGPDGKILHHDVISPNFRQIDKEKLIKPIKIFRESINDPCIDNFFNNGGEAQIWMTISQKKVLAVQIEGC